MDGPARRAQLDKRQLDKRPWGIAFAMVILLVVLGSLQYRWLGQVAEADRVRTRSALETAVQRFADDFNHELSRLFVGLRAGRLTRDLDRLGPAVNEALDGWRETAAYPRLVRQVYVVGPEGLRRIGPETGELLPLGERPDEALERLSERLGALLEDPPETKRGRPPVPFSLLADEVPALILPFLEGRPAEGRPAEGRPAEGRPAEGRSHRSRDERRRRWFRRDPTPDAFLIVDLDRRVLVERLLPALAERHFGRALRYHLEVLDSSDPGERIFAWGPDAEGTSVDAQAELFGPLIDDRVRRRTGPDRLLGALAALGQLDRGRWRLVARHPEGSLDVALERARRRNLAVASGILLVLCGALVLLARGTARSRRLARQQLDFVAGITHELMTPLAALRSAGQNLADGVVTDPAQVSRYGKMIDREGRRLSDLVGQVLAFARMQSSGPGFQPVPVDAAEAVHAVADELRPLLESENIELELTLGNPAEGDLPPVLADRQALVRALGNLVGNAVKYGQASPRDGAGWIGLRVRRRGAELSFEVEDRGPGIPSGERSAIFEPFSRGSDKAASAVPGTGLGLALVRHWIEAQGGKVRLTSSVGRGSTFTITLPIAEPTEKTEPTQKTGETGETAP